MKILQVTNAYFPAIEFGGPVRSVASLAQGLIVAGHSVSVLTTNRRGPGLIPIPEDSAVVQGVNVYYSKIIGRGSFSFCPTMIGQFRRLLHQADVVHIHGLWTFPSLLASRICHARGVPYVVSPRGSLDPYCLKQKRIKKAIYFHLAERTNLRQASLLHFTADEEHQLAPPEVRDSAYVVIPNAIDAPRLAELPLRRLNPTDVRIVMVGRIHSKKGFELAIQALRIARGAGQHVSLSIVGPDEGGYRAKVEAMASALGITENVHFTGLLDGEALAKEYMRADILMMPSFQENFGMSAAEAMLAGRPVIVSNTVNIASCVQASGAGIVVPLDVSAIVSAIQRLVSEPDEALAMGKRGRDFATATYSVEAVGRRMAEAYLNIILDCSS